MARVTGKHITGVLGPVNLRRYRRKQTMSIRAEKIKQTAATIRCSNTFGKANLLVQSIRERFSFCTRGFYDGTMYNRMNSVMSMIFYESREVSTMEFAFSKKSFEKLADFDFNIKSPLLHSLRIKPEVSLDDNNLVTITLDAIKVPAQLKFQGKSTYCKIAFNLLIYSLKGSLFKGVSDLFSVIVSKDQKNLEEQMFQFKVPNGCLCLVVCYLDFWYNSAEYQILENNPAFNPAAIIAAIVSNGESEGNDDLKWRNDPYLNWS
ncbi:hypothetical protein SAMN06265348_111161 [Pedobacter westerhofensis]|uniref:Uncharacterized protein n=1 Tax=Pedobacter westerhofensis TaxID=425512 RepID=A0A521FDP0_9SPHI|nr:hypothetical protein [Pedobacter westerhofensis]SMO94259.1 hypothetical protein SAMN06265348_111161 [Pedobacter westerhofensis]